MPLAAGLIVTGVAGLALGVSGTVLANKGIQSTLGIAAVAAAAFVLFRKTA